MCVITCMGRVSQHTWGECFTTCMGHVCHSVHGACVSLHVLGECVTTCVGRVCHSRYRAEGSSWDRVLSFPHVDSKGPTLLPLAACTHEVTTSVTSKKEECDRSKGLKPSSIFCHGRQENIREQQAMQSQVVLKHA